MKRLVSVLAATAVLAAASSGWASAAPAAWTLDKAASRIGFKSSFGGMAIDGTFRRWDAVIQFDPKALAASRVSVTVDVASAATATAKGTVSAEANWPLPTPKVLRFTLSWPFIFAWAPVMARVKGRTTGLATPFRLRVPRA